MALSNDQIAGILGGFVILCLLVVVISVVVYLMTSSGDPDNIYSDNTVVVLPDADFNEDIGIDPVSLEESDVAILEDEDDEVPLLPEDAYLLGDY